MPDYKKNYVDEILAELCTRLDAEPTEALRKKAVTIFNRMHKYNKSGEPVLEDTIFASSIKNAVSLFLLAEESRNITKKPTIKELNKVKFDAVYVSSAKIDTETVIQAAAESSPLKDYLQGRDDLILLDLILVVEGANLNKDAFTADELEKSYKTLIGMPLTEEHGLQEIQGVFYDSDLIDITVYDPNIDAHEMRKAIRASAVFYKDRFLDQAELLLMRAEKGTLKFSMEAMFTQSQCSVCGEVYDSPVDFCEHLWHRFDPSSTASRILLGVKFVGGAYVKVPAEPNAVLLNIEDFSEAGITAAAADRGPLFCYAGSNRQVVWSPSGVSSRSRSKNIEGGESSMPNKDFDLIMQTDEFKELFKSELDKALAAIQKDSETESVKEENDTLKAELVKATEKITELEKAIADRDADDRAKQYVQDLKDSGLALSSDQEAKFMRLFKTASDEDADAIKELALLKVQATETEEIETEEVEASEEEDELDDSIEASEELDDDLEEEVIASEEEEEVETRVEASARRKKLPKGKTEDFALASEVANPRARELVSAMRAAFKKNESL